MQSDIIEWNCNQLTTAYKQRVLSPVEMLKSLIDSIESDTNQINAFSAFDLEGASIAAKVAEARYAAGTPLSPLDGVPISIKDLIAMEGWTTQRGSKACATDLPANEDAPAVTLLRNAGAVLFARTTTTEFGWEVGSTNPLNGITRNPLAVDHTAGGSSSGAAAHLAQGWGPLALGSDAGGSVRIPASYVGIVAFKPTLGAIPMPPVSVFAELAHLGPMARTLEDCTIAYRVLSKPDVRDPNSMFARRAYIEGRPVKIAWSLPAKGQTTPSPAVVRAFRAAIEVLGRRGFNLHEVKWPGTQETALAMWILWSTRLFESFTNWQPERRKLLGVGLLLAYEEGGQQSIANLAWARIHLRELTMNVSRIFETCDLWLTPATAGAAPLTETDSGYRWFDREPYCYPFNLTQQPALVWPLGRNARGLPFGIQLAGRRFDDELVLSVGKQLEQALR